MYSGQSILSGQIRSESVAIEDAHCYASAMALVLAAQACDPCARAMQMADQTGNRFYCGIYDI